MASKPRKLSPDAEQLDQCGTEVPPRNLAPRIGTAEQRRIAVAMERHRLRLLVKSPRAFDLPAYLHEWLTGPVRKKQLHDAWQVNPRNALPPYIGYLTPRDRAP
jgi:hypothetical protein